MDDETRDFLRELKGSLAMITDWLEDVKAANNRVIERLDSIEAHLNAMEQAWLNELKGIYRRLESLENGTT